MKKWQRWADYDRSLPEYQNKLVSAERAVKAVKSGDRVFIAFLSGAPKLLIEALARRKDELENVEICESIANYKVGWHEPGTEKAFKLLKSHMVGIDHDALENGRRFDYYPWGTFRDNKQMVKSDMVGGCVGLYDSDVFMVKVTPPDKNGFCSFGDVVWVSKMMSSHAKKILAEVCEGMIRTYGDNYIHISEIDYFVENNDPVSLEPIAPNTRHAAGAHIAKERNEEEIVATEIIGETVACELVKDRDTIEMGIGLVSSAMPAYFYNKHDLGIHSEGYPGAIMDLVRDGIVTGKYKTLNKGKVVATSMFRGSKEQKAFADNNPVFELRDISYTNNLKNIMAQNNMVAINNALMVDLTGQIASETIGTRIMASPGGQTDFTIGAQWSRGGRAITVTPSRTRDGKISRIVPVIPSPTMVTIPRTYADYIVTQHGIARLRGKSLKQRIGEMIAIAHPDFQSELKKEAQRLYAIWI